MLPGLVEFHRSAAEFTAPQKKKVSPLERLRSLRRPLLFLVRNPCASRVPINSCTSYAVVTTTPTPTKTTTNKSCGSLSALPLSPLAAFVSLLGGPTLLPLAGPLVVGLFYVVVGGSWSWSWSWRGEGRWCPTTRSALKVR